MRGCQKSQALADSWVWYWMEGTLQSFYRVGGLEDMDEGLDHVAGLLDPCKGVKPSKFDQKQFIHGDAGDSLTSQAPHTEIISNTGPLNCHKQVYIRLHKQKTQVVSHEPL